MPSTATNNKSRFLDLRALAALQHMRFTTKHKIDGTYSGRHQSRQQGGSAEFVDFREYVQGEDLRHLDWKVLARTGRAYVRLYQDETNLLCTLAIDASGSMLFGAGWGGSKLEYAQYLSTALTEMIGHQQDQVGLAIIADGLNEHLSPGSTPGHVARVQERIEQIQTRPVTKLADGLRDLFQRLNHRGVLVVMSDFLADDLEAIFESIRLFRHRFWEVVVLHLVHPQEERLPDGRAYRFEGLEAEGTISCSPEEIQALYRERFEAYAGMVRKLSLAEGCDYRRVSTAVSYLRTLADFLVERAG